MSDIDELLNEFDYTDDLVGMRFTCLRFAVDLGVAASQDHEVTSERVIAFATDFYEFAIAGKKDG